jgi:phage/plasmid-associated DNA primase
MTEEQALKKWCPFARVMRTYSPDDAVAAATDLVRERNFTVPPSSDVALKDWVRLADPVMGWAAARIRYDKPDAIVKSEAIKSSAAYASFREWALATGYRPEHIPAVNGFVQRLRSLPRIYVKHGKTEYAKNALFSAEGEGVKAWVG